MLIFPAIDLYGGQAVRLYKGDYRQMTVYSPHPLEVAQTFQEKGASCIHLVDLEGAKTGGTPNLRVVTEIVSKTKLFSELGGGIRSLETIRRYLDAGVDRVILGTAAVTDPAFLEEAIRRHGRQIAVGVDIRNGYVAIKGWTEQSSYTCDAFCHRLQGLGVETLVCTDISRDGAMEGANLELYQRLSRTYQMNLIASGGVSSLEDIRKLRAMKLHGAIIGKAYYTGAIDLAQALEAAT